jgi:hypothetical protein
MSSSEVRKGNEEAVHALVSLLGGATSMVNRNIRLTSLVPVLNADPSDDLSGLRLLASRMTYDSGLASMPGDVSCLEPYVYPEEAESWLLRTARVTKTQKGLVPTDDFDHLGEAALSIVHSDEPGLMTEAYDIATNNRSPLNPGMVKDIAHMMVSEFVPEPGAPRF